MVRKKGKAKGKKKGHSLCYICRCAFRFYRRAADYICCIVCKKIGSVACVIKARLILKVYGVRGYRLIILFVIPLLLKFVVLVYFKITKADE